MIIKKHDQDKKHPSFTFLLPLDGGGVGEGDR
jgi:hypothetical protein